MSAGGYVDVCKFLPTAGGLTDFTFSTAVTGYQSPASAGISNGVVYSYRAESTDLTQWEIGFGAYNTGTGVLARTTVNASSTGSKINFSAAPQVSITALTADLQNAALLTSGTLPVARINGGTVNQFVQGDGTFQLQGRKLLNTLTAAASATLSDTTSLTATFAEYEIVFENIVPASAAQSAQLQVHSGGAFQGASYVTNAYQVAAGPTAVANNAATGVPITNSNATNAAPGISGKLTIFTPSSSSLHAIVGQMFYYSGTVGVTWSVGSFWNSSAVIDGFQFLMGSGNITSGSIKIYGLN